MAVTTLRTADRIVVYCCGAERCLERADAAATGRPQRPRHNVVPDVVKPPETRPVAELDLPEPQHVQKLDVG